MEYARQRRTGAICTSTRPARPTAATTPFAGRGSASRTRAPDVLYDTCVRRGMTFVTVTDHNTVEGALRIADRPNTFLSVEVTTRFPEDDVPLHVLVWNLTEQDHRDLQPLPRVGLRARRLLARTVPRARARAPAVPDGRAAHPLARRAHDAAVLGVGGAERRQAGELEHGRGGAGRVGHAGARSSGSPSVTGSSRAMPAASRSAPGSDDHGALDIATTFTEAARQRPSRSSSPRSPRGGGDDRTASTARA